MEERTNYAALMEVKARNHGGFIAPDILDVLPEDGDTDMESQTILHLAGASRRRETAEQKHQPLTLQASSFRSLKSASNAVLVTATLLATINFQLALRPPQGFIQSNQVEENDQMINHMFYLFNSVAFFTSLAIITVILQDLPFKLFLHILMLSSVGAYMCGIIMNSPEDVVMVVWTACIVSFCVLPICLASHTTLFKYIRGFSYTLVSSLLNKV